MIKYVVWDWNGTLYDDLSESFRSINALLKENSLPELRDLESYRRVFCFPITKYYENVGFDFAITPYEPLANRYMEIYHAIEGEGRLMKGAAETLEALRKKGVHQLVLSMTRTDHLDRQVSLFGVRDYFDRLLGMNNIYGHTKADLARALYEENLCRTDEMLYIGDTIHDTEMAKLLHCRCLLFSGGHQALPDVPDANVIAALPEIMNYIEQ